MVRRAVRQWCRSQDKKRRMEVDTPYFLKSRLNAGCCSAIFCYTALLLHCLTAPPLYGVDFGTHGTIFPIEEADPIVLIQQKLKSLEESGDLKKHQESLQKKTQEAVKRPNPVEGVTKATESRLFYYDPAYVVEHDLKDHTGKVFAKTGTKINPLKTVSLSHTLLFFDGDDAEQKAWAQGRTQKSEDSDQNDQKVRLILTKGAPLTLSEELGVPIYFDQGGTLTKKLGIKHMPALVTQEGLSLRIEEICPPPFAKEGCSSKDEELILERSPFEKMKKRSVSKTSCFDRPCNPLPEEMTL